MAADFALLGAPVEETQIVSRNEAFEVWPENWNSVIAFLACETQWHAVGTLAALIWTGVDYCALDVVMRRLKSPDRVFDDVRLMEREALAVFAEAG